MKRSSSSSPFFFVSSSVNIDSIQFNSGCLCLSEERGKGIWLSLDWKLGPVIPNSVCLVLACKVPFICCSDSLEGFWHTTEKVKQILRGASEWSLLCTAVAQSVENSSVALGFLMFKMLYLHLSLSSLTQPICLCCVSQIDTISCSFSLAQFMCKLT